MKRTLTNGQLIPWWPHLNGKEQRRYRRKGLISARQQRRQRWIQNSLDREKKKNAHR